MKFLKSITVTFLFFSESVFGAKSLKDAAEGLGIHVGAAYAYW